MFSAVSFWGGIQTSKETTVPVILWFFAHIHPLTWPSSLKSVQFEVVSYHTTVLSFRWYHQLIKTTSLQITWWLRSCLNVISSTVLFSRLYGDYIFMRNLSICCCTNSILITSLNYYCFKSIEQWLKSFKLCWIIRGF